MAVFVRKEGATVVLELEGRMAMGAVDEFRTKWALALESGAKVLIINLSKVTMMDSSGIGTMIRCHSAANAAGGKIRVVGANTTVRTAFKVTRLDKVFDFYEDEASALAAGAASNPPA